MKPTTETIPIDRILTDARFQPRGDGQGEAIVAAAELDRMAAAARDAGYVDGWHPGLYDLIHVWPDPEAWTDDLERYFVIKGFHRRALAERCGLTDLQVVIHREADEAQARRLADRSNSDTRPMDPVAEAEVLRRAFAEGLTADQVARRFDRRAPSYYDRRVTLAYLCDNLKLDVRQKTIGIDYAEAIGAAAKQGASPTLQQLLADLGRKTKARPELFRRLVAVIVAKAKGETPPAVADALTLFDLADYTDSASEAIQGTLTAAATAAGIRDGWADIRQSIKVQLRRIERSGQTAPELLAQLSAEVDAQVAAADRAVADAVGESAAPIDGEDQVAQGIREAKPLLKWVGGKGREAPTLLPWIRDRLGNGRYIEPFLGGGGVFFALAPDRAQLGDALPDLIGLYRSVAATPTLIAAEVQVLAGSNTAEGFADVRAAYNAARRADGSPDALQAARLIFLNRTGFNGLHRTNKAGHFNVPFGKYTSPAFPTLADLERAATLLRRAEIHCGDWKALVDQATAGDVIFLDPPYPGTFQGYATAERPVDIAELARSCESAWQRGAGVVVTLPDTPEMWAHFEGWCTREPLTRRTGIAAVASARAALSQAAYLSLKH